MLTHGYALNHTALATHWMQGTGRALPGVPIHEVASALSRAPGISMNPDGLV